MKKQERLHFKVSDEYKKAGGMDECDIAAHFAVWNNLNSDLEPLDRGNFAITKFYERTLGHLQMVTSADGDIVGITGMTLDGIPNVLKKGVIQLKPDTQYKVKNHYTSFQEYTLAMAAQENGVNDTILEIDGCKVLKYFPDKIVNVVKG